MNPRHGLAHIDAAVVLSAKRDYAGAWRQLRLGQECGATPPPGLAEFVAGKIIRGKGQ